MTWSSPRLLSSLALTFVLAPCLACDDEDSLEIAGTATFKGTAYAFDQGRAVIYMAGTAMNPCIDVVQVTAQNETEAIEVTLSPPEGGGALELIGLTFGVPNFPGEYDLYLDDLPKFDVTFDLEESDEDRARASLEVTGTGTRMALAASDDWGPYPLTNVELSVTGGWSIEWVEACD